MPTILQIVRGALNEIGVLAGGEDPQAAEGADALSIFNDYIDSLGADRLAMYAVIRTVKTLASGTASYTIGTGGDISLVRPNWIQDAMLVLDSAASPPREVPLDILTDTEYAEWSDKARQGSSSQAIYFDHGWTAGLGIVYPLPIPNVGTTQLVLYTPSEPIAQAASLTTSVTFPPGIRRMLRKNLALELAPSYPGAVISPLLMQQAAESKAKWKSSNVRPTTRGCDPALLRGGGWFDMDSGGYRR